MNLLESICLIYSSVCNTLDPFLLYMVILELSPAVNIRKNSHNPEIVFAKILLDN